MARTTNWLLCLGIGSALALTSYGCGGGNSDDTSLSDIAGSWVVRSASTGKDAQTCPATFVIDGVEKQVCSGATGFTLSPSGTVSSGSGTGQQAIGLNGSFQGTATIEGDTLKMVATDGSLIVATIPYTIVSHSSTELVLTNNLSKITFTLVHPTL